MNRRRFALMSTAAIAAVTALTALNAPAAHAQNLYVADYNTSSVLRSLALLALALPLVVGLSARRRRES